MQSPGHGLQWSGNGSVYSQPISIDVVGAQPRSSVAKKSGASAINARRRSRRRRSRPLSGNEVRMRGERQRGVQAHDGAKILQCLLELVVDDREVELDRVRHLVARRGQAARQSRRGRPARVHASVVRGIPATAAARKSRWLRACGGAPGRRPANRSRCWRRPEGGRALSAPRSHSGCHAPARARETHPAAPRARTSPGRRNGSAERRSRPAAAAASYTTRSGRLPALPLRLLFAAHSEFLTPLLRIVHRVITGFLLKQAGLNGPSSSRPGTRADTRNASYTLCKDTCGSGGIRKSSV